MIDMQQLQQIPAMVDTASAMRCRMHVGVSRRSALTPGCMRPHRRMPQRLPELACGARCIHRADSSDTSNCRGPTCAVSKTKARRWQHASLVSVAALPARLRGNTISAAAQPDESVAAAATDANAAAGDQELLRSDPNRYYMRRALRLAERGVGHTHPNPAVGSVIVRDGEVVGEGYHPKAGMPHAEVYALRAAGQKARGATAYVTLEPCAHYGRTPPCALALVEAGVARVVVGVTDPNPLVGGAGIKILQDAGIEVTSGVEEDSCYAINQEFMEHMAAQAAAAKAQQQQAAQQGPAQ